MTRIVDHAKAIIRGEAPSPPVAKLTVRLTRENIVIQTHEANVLHERRPVTTDMGTAWRAPSALRQRCGWGYSKTSISGTHCTSVAQSTSASSGWKLARRHSSVIDSDCGDFVSTQR